jgi:hypothetical protein
MHSDAVGYVYVLIDPNNADIRYIGQSAAVISNTLSRHRTQTPIVSDWFKELSAAGNPPIILKLEDGLGQTDRYIREGHWINLGLHVGWPLLNVDLRAKDKCACPACMYVRIKRPFPFVYSLPPDIVSEKGRKKYAWMRRDRLLARIDELEELLDIALRKLYSD